MCEQQAPLIDVGLTFSDRSNGQLLSGCNLEAFWTPFEPWILSLLIQFSSVRAPPWPWGSCHSWQCIRSNGSKGRSETDLYNITTDFSDEACQPCSHSILLAMLDKNYQHNKGGLQITNLVVSVSLRSSRLATLARIFADITPDCERFSCGSPVHSSISRILAAALATRV